MDINSLIDTFREASIEKGDGDTPDERDSQLFTILSDTYDEIERFGEDGIKLFKSLLNDESPHVRLWVASQLLYNTRTEDDDPISVLKELSSSNTANGFSASMVLDQYQNGELKSPL